MSRQRASQKKGWAAPLGELVVPCLGPVLAKQGFAAADLVLAWPEFVGARLAPVCEVVRLRWPPRLAHRDHDPAGGGAPSATLVVRVEGAFALELQHMAAAVIERVNAHLGWRCVGKLALRQGPVGRAAVSARAPLGGSPQALARAEAIASAVDDAPLREALTRLGCAVFASRSAGR